MANTPDKSKDTAKPSSEYGTPTDNERVFLCDDGEGAVIILKRPPTVDKFPCLKLLDAARELKDGELVKVKLRMPRVSDRLAVAKMPVAQGNQIAFEFHMIAKLSELPVEVLETVTMGDWENIQDALGKLTD